MEPIDTSRWNKDGFIVLPQLTAPEELAAISRLYNDFLADKYDLNGFRSDLSGDYSPGKKVEKITQIMRPSLIVDELMRTATYARAIRIARQLMGDDMAIDFDMMIDKAPGTNAVTPWHQDAAYWPRMDDKRALSFWIALDRADRENGCMMYVPGSHLEPLRPHFQPTPNAALQCVVEDDRIAYGEIEPGDAIAHHGHTLHGALGNTSADRHRRALIINLRPQKMIDYIRGLGYDHLGKREVKNL